MCFLRKKYLKTPSNDISNVHQQFGLHDKQRNSMQARQVDIRLQRLVVISVELVTSMLSNYKLQFILMCVSLV